MNKDKLANREYEIKEVVTSLCGMYKKLLLFKLIGPLERPSSCYSDTTISVPIKSSISNP